MNRVRAALVFVALLAWSAAAHAQVAQSDFAAGDEGWFNVMLPYPSALPPNVLSTYVPTWAPGSLTLQDPDGANPTGNVQYWQAPAKFLGNRLAAYGDSLVYELSNVGVGFPPFVQDDVILTNGTLVLTYELGTLPGTARTHLAVPLSETGWHRGTLAGPVPTPVEFQSVLGSLTQLLIRAEYQLGPDTEVLYSVVMAPHRTTGVAPASTPRSLALSAPYPNPGAGSTRLEFSLPAAADADVAVFDAAGRRVRTLVHATLGAGVHPLVWDGRDAAGRTATPGLYWVRLAAGGQTATRRFVRID